MRRLRVDRIAPSSPTGPPERMLELEERARRMRAPYGKRELAVPRALLDASD